MSDNSTRLSSHSLRAAVRRIQAFELDLVCEQVFGRTLIQTFGAAGGGGSQSTGGIYTVDGTIGQNLAGTVSSGGGNSLRGGFWAFQSLAPTAANASISGRILTFEGYGIRSVSITLTNLSTAEVRSGLSSAFGYYRFDEILVGQTYILTVNSKRFSFNPNTRVITLLDELTDEDFTALP